jgi:hypothetical protein
MRRLASKDPRKRRKLHRLAREATKDDGASTGDEDDASLRSLVAKTEALAAAAPPGGGCRLRKSRSVLAAGGSRPPLVSTAKDISMNAFLAMKNSEKDSKWLQSFLSETVVEDVPWECSKALILLKEGYQVRLV